MSRFPMAAVAGACLLAACTTLSPEERAAACANTDWHRFGVNDGTLGVPISERIDRIDDCAELGQPVDIAAYRSGRQEGLETYCTVEHGYEVGYAGRSYEDVCPPELEPDFLQGYAEGRDDRPSFGLYPGFGIGIGSGGVGTRVGVGLGVGLYDDGYYPYRYYPYGYGFRRYGRCGRWYDRHRHPFPCW